MRADGTLPQSVMDGNTETEHATEIGHAIVKHGGFLLVETPARRRVGTTHLPHHALDGCEKHAHMLDHPAWVRLTKLTGAKEIGWDQCPLADVPEESAIKSTIWWATPNIYPIINGLFGHFQCFHPKGTHKKLKGVGADGRFLTTFAENYSTGTNRLIARGLQWYLSGTLAGVCESEHDAVPQVPPAMAGISKTQHADATPPAAPPGTLVLPPGLRRRDLAATPSEVDAFILSDAGSFGFVAGVIRGKHLARHAVTHDFLHNAFDHAEARVLRLLVHAICDAEPWWAELIVEKPCEACITGDASRLGPSGSLPRTEGLVFLDIWHYTIPDIITGCKTVVGVTHAASRKRKSVKVKTKGEAHLAMEIIIAYFESVGKPITWIHTDAAPELKGSEMVPLARRKNIRITTTVVGRSRQNPQEPSWRAQSTSTRKNLEQSRLPDNFWGPAWDDAEDASDLIPSRAAPHDCALGRLLSTADKTIKPAGGYRRAFGSLCYPTLAPRLPSGTLVNKMKSQSQRAILLGYAGGRGGAGEGLGFRERSQAGYICYLPESNSTIVTDDVRIIYDEKTGQGVFPGLVRKVGGGWAIPSSRIPFATDGAAESNTDDNTNADTQDISDLTGDEATSAEPTLDFAPGFAPEPSRGGDSDHAPPPDDVPSRGGDIPHAPLAHTTSTTHHRLHHPLDS